MQEKQEKLIQTIEELKNGVEKYLSRMVTINHSTLNTENSTIDTPLFKALWHAYIWEMEVGNSHSSVDSFVCENLPMILDELNDYGSEYGVLLVNSLYNPQLYKIYEANLEKEPFWFSVKAKENTDEYEDYQVFLPGNPIFRIVKTKEAFRAPYEAFYTVDAEEFFTKNFQVVANFYKKLTRDKILDADIPVSNTEKSTYIDNFNYLDEELTERLNRRVQNFQYHVDC